MQFHKDNVKPEWWDLINEFPEFILELSPEVNDWYQKALQTEYSDDHIPPNKEDFINLRYSFECGLGWKDIIREYFTEMRDLIKKASDNGDEIFYKTCIFKEKFGTACDQGDFYGKNKGGYWDDYVNICNKFYNKSSITCEVCGKVGKLRSKGKGWGGWVKCLCDDHALELGYYDYSNH